MANRHGRLPVPVQALELYHPMGLTEDWADKMQGQNFYSKNQRATFEHYMQVSRRTQAHVLHVLCTSNV